MSETRGEDLGLGELIANDLQRLHTGWMGIVFPRQRNPHPVLGREIPESTTGRIGYRLWSLLGVPLLAISYPLAVIGLFVRFHSRRLYRTSIAIGVLGVMLLSVVVWGALVAFTYLRGYSAEGIVAVAAGGITATVSSALAVTFTRYGGRVTTVVLAYPFGVTALFLPPVVAAMYSPALAAWVFPYSDTLALWLLDGPLSAAGLAGPIRTYFDLIGIAYVGMWFAIAVPVGWGLGILVSLADLIRPSGTEEASES